MIDDDERWLKHLKSSLSGVESLEIIFTANNGLECLKMMEHLAPNNHPEVILIDMAMPQLNGVETTRFLKERYPSIEVIIMTVLDDEDTLIQAVVAGAKGYLLKSDSPQKMLQILQMVKSGFALLSPSISSKIKGFLSHQSSNLAQTPKLDNPEDTLTPRESEVLDLLSRGDTYQEIARVLHRDIGTIKTHVNNIYKKLEVRNKTEAINKWRKDG